MAYNKRILSEIDRELKDRYRSKRYSKSLAATNSLFAVNDLFAKPSRRRIYNPHAQYFQDGGMLQRGGVLKAIAKNSKKILNKKDGQPYCVLNDKTFNKKILISLSHCKYYAIANAIISS